MSLDASPVPNYATRLRFDGKVFVIIGAGQGMGRQSAHALSQYGARIVCVGRSAGMTEAVAGEVGGVAKLADANKRADLERVFSETKDELGRVDGVVNTLGAPLRKAIAEFTDDDWQSQLDVNLKHVLLTMQIGGRAIAASGGGSITFVGSTGGVRGSVGQAPYGMVKAALHHFVSVAAVELGPTGVRVNVVSPAVTRTPRLEQRLGKEQWAAIEALYPLGKAATTPDIAGVILFLASGLAAHVNGQTIVVDGGLTNRSPLFGVDFGGKPAAKA